MEIKEFISETLVQTQEGVQDAIARRASGKSPAGVINPVSGLDMDGAGEMHVQKVDFDVAATVTEKSGGGAKAGIKAFSIELAGEPSKGAEQSTASRVEFAIPFIPPVQLIKPIRESVS